MNFLKSAFNTVAHAAKSAGGAILNAAGKTARVPLQAIFNANMFVVDKIDKFPLLDYLEKSELDHPGKRGFYEAGIFAVQLASLPFGAPAMGALLLSVVMRHPINDEVKFSESKQEKIFREHLMQAAARANDAPIQPNASPKSSAKLMQINKF